MSKYAHGAAGPGVRHTQNFLTSARLIGEMIARAGIRRGDSVVEIGPGKGHITRALLQRGCAVTAVEIDPALCGRLEERFGGEAGFRLVRGDFLGWPLPREGDYAVFSNIPFDGTTAIVRKLAEAGNPPRSAHLIVEAGAARALCGQPRESLRSLGLKPVFEAEVARRIAREAFHPTPSVDAALLALSRRECPDLLPREMAAYRAFLGRCFRSPRGVAEVFTGKQLHTALRRAGVAPGTQMGDIRYIQWLCLFRCALHFGLHRT